MQFNEYQQQANHTKIYPQEHNVIYPTLGLVGEAGELANKVKKVLRGDTTLPEVQTAIISELGDCLWYMAALATDLEPRWKVWPIGT